MINNRSHWYWKLGLASSWAITGVVIELPGEIITSSGNRAFAQAVPNPTLRRSSLTATRERIYIQPLIGWIERSRFPAVTEPSLRIKSTDNIRIFRPSSLPELTEPSLKSEASDISKLLDQSCSTKSEFFVTGRGGLPPAPGEVLRSDPALVDLGPPALTREMHRGSQRPIRGHSIKHYSSSASSNPTSSPPATIEAQGWMANSQGEVVLTVQASNVTPRSPWITSASCDPQTSL